MVPAKKGRGANTKHPFAAKEATGGVLSGSIGAIVGAQIIPAGEIDSRNIVEACEASWDGAGEFKQTHAIPEWRYFTFFDAPAGTHQRALRQWRQDVSRILRDAGDKETDTILELVRPLKRPMLLFKE